MKKLLLKNRSFLLAAIILLAAVPLSFQLSDIGGETRLSFVFLEVFPMWGFVVGVSACVLAFLTFDVFDNAQKWGVIALFAFAPLTSFSIGGLPTTLIAWDYMPVIGVMYWGAALIFLVMRRKYSVG